MARESKLKPIESGKRRRSGKASPQSAALASVRADAAIYYITHDKQPSLADMARMPEFGVSLKTLSAWCAQDRWVDRRHKFYKDLTLAATRQIGSEILKVRRRDFEDLEAIRTKAIAHLDGPEAMPKSFEGVTKVFLDAVKVRGELLTQMAQELPPVDEHGVKSAEELGVDKTELQRLTAELLRNRNAKFSAALVINAPAAPEAITERTVDNTRTLDAREEDEDDDGSGNEGLGMDRPE